MAAALAMNEHPTYFPPGRLMFAMLGRYEADLSELFTRADICMITRSAGRTTKYNN